MPDDIKAIIKEYLKDNLTISVDSCQDYYWRGFKVEVKLDGETITSDTFALEHDRNYG